MIQPDYTKALPLRSWWCQLRIWADFGWFGGFPYQYRRHIFLPVEKLL